MKSPLYFALCALFASSSYLLVHAAPLSTEDSESKKLIATEPLTHIIALADDKKGIGARPAGSKQERQAAQYIFQQLQRMGLKAEQQTFAIEVNETQATSMNISAVIPGESKKRLVIGAHFDSTGVEQGSLGATDNASGVAVLLAVSEQLVQMRGLPYSVQVVFFGSEEIGKLGSNYFVHAMSRAELGNIIAMLNLDTVIGGDVLYVHSSSPTDFSCKKIENAKLNTSGVFRDALLAYGASQSSLPVQFELHEDSEVFAAGQTGDWSDHQAFACNNIPIAYIEATNMDINGRGGKDGYSQSIEAQFWTCYSGKKIGSCDPDKEKKWGEIWHTQFDRLDRLFPVFNARMIDQLDANISLIVGALNDPETMAKLGK